MSKKNIVLVINTLQGNGAERVVLTLADGFIKEGHQCHIVCFKDFQELSSATAITPHIFRMNMFRWIPRKLRGTLVAPLFDLYIKSKFGRPDLLLSNLIPVDRVLAHSRLKNVFLIVHNTFSKEFNLVKENSKRQKTINILNHIYCKKPLICVSDGVKNDLKNVFNCQTKAKRIYNPVDIDYIRQQSLLESNYPDLPEEFYLHIGKFNRAKRQDFLIKAYAQSKIKTPLVLMGQGPLKEQCQTLVKELNLEEKIIFSGFFNNPYPILKKAKGLFVSSDYEGLGMVILEAIVLGVPVISTNCESGPREILPSKNLVPLNNKQAYAEKIQMIEDNPKNFKTTFNKCFKKEQSIKNYLSLIA